MPIPIVEVPNKVVRTQTVTFLCSKCHKKIEYSYNSNDWQQARKEYEHPFFECKACRATTKKPPFEGRNRRMELTVTDGVKSAVFHTSFRAMYCGNFIKGAITTLCYKKHMDTDKCKVLVKFADDE